MRIEKKAAMTEVEGKSCGCQGMLFKGNYTEWSLDGLAFDLLNVHTP